MNNFRGNTLLFQRNVNITAISIILAIRFNLNTTFAAEKKPITLSVAFRQPDVNIKSSPRPRVNE